MFYYSFYLPYTFLPFILIGAYFLFEKHLTQTWHKWLWWLLCIIFLVWIGWFAVQEGSSLYDFFKGYYHGGRKILRNPDELYDATCYGYTNFPLLAYLFALLGSMPQSIAGAIFYIIGYVSLLPLGYWLIKLAELKGGHRFLVLALLSLNGPLDYSIWLGNTTHIIMLLIVLALIFFKQDKEWISGVLLALSGLIKLPLILPSGYFFVRGKWKVVAGGLLIASIAFALSLYLIPTTLNTIWIEKCILSISGNPIPAYNNQSLSAVLARVFMPGDLSWEPINPTSEYQKTIKIGNGIFYLSALVILFWGRNFQKNKFGYMLEFFIILTCSLLTSPISWTHYFALLLIPTTLFFGDIKPALPNWMWGLLFISAIFLSAPVQFTYALFEQTGNAIFLSIHFFGALILYIFLLLNWVKMKLANST
jgi:hypothetical protein